LMFAASYPRAALVLLISIFDLAIRASSLSHQAAEKKKKGRKRNAHSPFI